MPKPRVSYELYYWPEIQGRGEFIRLALEDAGASYRDVAREPRGMQAMLRLLRDADAGAQPFAPPFLRSGKLLIAQTGAILDYLGARHGLAPASPAGRYAVLQHQLTLADFVGEVHDTHHPLGVGLYYEQQKAAAKTRSQQFVTERMPKFLLYFERLLERNRSGRQRFLVGNQCSYADLSLFQVFEGLRYAFPRALTRLSRKLPRTAELHARVAQRPRLAEYLRSPRRIPYSEQGIFRHYEALDIVPAGKARSTA